MFDQDDEYLGGKGIPVTQTVYDDHGAPVKRISMDKDRNVINDPNSGVAITEYKYDEAGRRIETLIFDKEGNPVEKKS
jgi:YD repeat-containing protein